MLASARADPRLLRNLADVQASLAASEHDDAQLDTQLLALLDARQPITASIHRLHSLLPHFTTLHEHAALLTTNVDTTAQTAKRVGGRVRALDEEMRRVREASERVGQVIELKASLSALQASMDEQDWESATRHCARAMALPAQVVDSPFSQVAVPTAESHLPPSQTLQNAREHLLAVFLKHFQAASASRDSAATSRFFKLFPAIGWEQEGLQAYASFVVDLVRVQAPTSAKTSSPLYYVTALTALFESIAMIVDQHQPVVEKYYGKGKMTSVIERLLAECDRVVKSLLEGWEEERAVRRKLTDVLANPPMSFLTSSSSSSNARVNRAQGSASTAIGAGGARDEDAVDAREIDKTLGEISAMSGRWNVFKKFLIETLAEEEEEDVLTAGRPSISISISEGPPIPPNTPGIVPPHPTTPAAAASNSNTSGGAAVVIPPVAPPHPVQTADSQALFDGVMSRYYTPFEVWYTRSVTDKAHALSTPDPSSPATTTTTPDDVFYLLKLVLNRLISTGSLPTVQRTAVQIGEVMEREYVGVLKRRMDDVYRGGGGGAGGGGGGVGGGVERERETRGAFIILLNDLDLSLAHLDRLIRDVSGSPGIGQNFLVSEQEGVREAVAGLVGIAGKVKSHIRGGIEQLFNQLLRPKLRTFITDIYKDVSYVLDEDAYAQAEYADVVRKRFARAWEAVGEGYRDLFRDANYRLFFGLILDVVLRPWEKVVMSFKYSDLGAIRFDRDIRSVIGYLSSSTSNANAAFVGDARQKFGRLQQVSTVLNLDDEEDVDEFYNSSGISWKLSAEEARAVAALKV